MLCQDVDVETRDSVAIKVADVIASGYIHREGGYILKLDGWVADDMPSSVPGDRVDALLV